MQPDDHIKLVQGDSLPYINLELRNSSNGEVVDLSNPNTIVRVRFRSSKTRTVLRTIVCEKSDPQVGKVKFNFSNGALDVPSGIYEGEIEVDFDGQTQTVFETLKFNVRSQFA